MAVETLSTITYILKDVYKNPAMMEFAAFKDKPLLAMMPKKYATSGGSSYIIPVTTALGAGFSNTFTTSQANANIQKGTRFSLGIFPQLYNVEQISNQLLMGARTSTQSFVNLVTQHAKTLVETVSWNTARQIYRSGTGSLARRASVSSNTITLTVPTDAAAFYPEMVIVASATDGGALRTGSAVVKGVDYGAGTVTVDSVAGISSFADNDFLYIQGTAANGGSNIALTGVAGWIPSTAPSATPFFGVDRTQAVQLLAGSRFDGTALDILSACLGGLNQVARFGGKPTHVFMNYEDYNQLLLVAGDKLRLVNVGSQNAKLSFSGVNITYAGGDCSVVPDAACPKGLAYALNMETWGLYIMHDMFPNVYTESGDAKIPMLSADAVEIRSNNYCQVACEAPIHNGVILLPSS